MSASARLAAATAVAASVFLTALPAVSADLYYPPRVDAPYDDARYADVYGDWDVDRAPYDRYAEPPADFEPPYRPRAALKDPKSFDDSFLDSKSFVAPYPPRERVARYDECVPRRVARNRLLRRGWDDFHDLELRGRVVLVKARRPSGRPFELTIDRCSGEVIEARPLHRRRFERFAHRRYWGPRF